jgi:hypothetical protein
MLYVYIFLGIYLLITLPLTILLYTTVVAAKWGDNGREVREIETEIDKELRWMPR